MLDIVLLIAVDYLFVRFPRTHVPVLDRHDSLVLLIGLNVALFIYLWIARSVPKWRARRVASTWCADERVRFFSEPRLR